MWCYWRCVTQETNNFFILIQFILRKKWQRTDTLTNCKIRKENLLHLNTCWCGVCAQYIGYQPEGLPGSVGKSASGPPSGTARAGSEGDDDQSPDETSVPRPGPVKLRELHVTATGAEIKLCSWQSMWQIACQPFFFRLITITYKCKYIVGCICRTVKNVKV
jgi:hypothetical protein